MLVYCCYVDEVTRGYMLKHTSGYGLLGIDTGGDDDVGLLLLCGQSHQNYAMIEIRRLI